MQFTFQTTEGSFCHPNGRWLLLFYYAGDFLPVSATELMALGRLLPALEQCGCSALAISGDSLATHLAFLETLSRYRPCPALPTLGEDPEGTFRRAEQKYLLLLDPSGQARACFCYPPEIGVNFTEAHRTLLALQTDRPTPADWVPGAYTLALPPQTRQESLEFMHQKEAQGHIAIDWYLSFETEPED